MEEPTGRNGFFVVDMPHCRPYTMVENMGNCSP
jgi:hypothetical protein